MNLDLGRGSSPAAPHLGASLVSKLIIRLLIKKLMFSMKHIILQWVFCNVNVTCVILDNDQLDAFFLNVFILHLYMFRAASAHHREVQIVLIHHLV
jgi:hypothetical protein